MCVMEHWHRLHEEVVEPTFLETFKICLDNIQGNLLWISLLEQEGWIR